jgi:hypothetical protein
VDRGNLATILAAAAVIAGFFLLVPALMSPPVPPGPAVPAPPAVLPTPSPVTPTPSPIPQGITPYRITYTGWYSSYPVVYLPSEMGFYGESDPPWRFNSSVRFAYLDEIHGGFTTVFTVPYPVWRINCTLSAWRNPENAHLRLLLVDVETGTTFEGIEQRTPGSVVKTVQSRFRPFYLIVSTDNVDRIFISLEAPAEFL